MFFPKKTKNICIYCIQRSPRWFAFFFFGSEYEQNRTNMPDHLFLRSSVYPFVCFYVCPLVCLSVSLSVGCPAMRERPFERESNLNLNRFRFLFFWPSQTSRKCFEDRTRFEKLEKRGKLIWEFQNVIGANSNTLVG